MSDSLAAGTPERVVLAEIHRPRGIRGELVARSLTDVPGRLKELKAAWVQFADGSDFEVTLEDAWEHKGNWVFKFAGVDSANDAERFKGADLWVPRSERAPLSDGEYYESDLMGCQVVDGASGQLIGSVSGWQHYGGPALMEVKRTAEAKAGREVLVPFVPAICRKVDVAARTIEVDLPVGLLDL
ncbi:MAG: ribosome maturation factor RimM [Bryobacteraceae bacterium]